MKEGLLKNLTIVLMGIAAVFAKAQDKTRDVFICKELNKAGSLPYTENDRALRMLAILKPYALASDSVAGLYYRIYGNIKVNMLDRDSALFYFNQAEKRYRKSGAAKELARTIMNTGGVYVRAGDYGNALKAYFSALNITETNNYKKTSAQLYKNIGSTYNWQGKNEQALKYYDKSMLLLQSLRDTVEMSQLFINIGNAYYDSYKQKESMSCYTKAIDLMSRMHDSSGLAMAYNNLGAVYIDLFRDTIQGINYLMKSLKLKEQMGHNEDRIMSYNNLGTLYTAHGDYAKALDYIMKAEQLAKRSGNRRELKEVYDNYAMLYKAQKDYKKAYENFAVEMAIKDSLVNIDKLKASDEIAAKYDMSRKDLSLARKELEIERQKKQHRIKNVIIIFIMVVSIGALLFIMYFFRNRRLLEHKRSEEKAALVMLESEQKERLRIARELHDNVGQKLTVLKMFSTGFKEPNPQFSLMLDNTIKEVRDMSHKMIPEILNLGLPAALRDLTEKINATGAVTCELNMNEGTPLSGISKETELSIYRIVQEVLSNMLRHSKANRITVELEQKQSAVSLTIADNGEGFDTKNIYHSQGMGWNNILTRARLILAKINVESSDKGTTVRLILPEYGN